MFAALSRTVCTHELHANYKGLALNITSAATLDSCCTLCKGDRACNIFVYCDNPMGCLHDNITEPYQQCVLKFQSVLNTWQQPPTWARGPNVSFV